MISGSGFHMPTLLKFPGSPCPPWTPGGFEPTTECADGRALAGAAADEGRLEPPARANWRRRGEEEEEEGEAESLRGCERPCLRADSPKPARVDA
ncbi:unnamed protein product [Prorocentrum cordatum]|uniref:Uncharacterized protein n=1 Tax=Prorocentrum cordatum TaxID=2364126 RepID=A0ABN9U4H8_9DINO|nr:unnamed protein product [Polarella glacialis]